jgi:biotin-dependent carboxylase-like uncharacterized protein
VSVEVLAPGLLTTVQDPGRSGSRHLGVGSAGALDAYSHAIANLLVGNAIDAPTLEITLAGPRLRLDQPMRIAICGAHIDARVGDIAVPGWRPVWLPANTTLTLGACRRGARAYLAVAGGVVVPSVLGSASTDLRGGFGGFRGRALAVGDVLELAPVILDVADSEVADICIAPWWIDPAPDLEFTSPAIIRVVSGTDSAAPSDALFAHAWRVASASDRQGLRLEGDPLQPEDARERLSEPVAPGTIQLPPDGRPIVLLADAQTHGGYPRIGHAIRADWPRLAQLRPGDALRFVSCTHEEARLARESQAQRLARIALAIAARMP